MIQHCVGLILSYYHIKYLKALYLNYATVTMCSDILTCKKEAFLCRTVNVDFQHRGKVTLATRSLIELEQYILEVYSDITETCNVCKRLCVKVCILRIF